MLKDADKLKSHADIIGKTTASIQAQAEDVVVRLKGFQDWGKKAIANLEERHTAIKAALDESHTGLVAELKSMDDQLAGIIKKLEGGVSDG